MLDQETVDLYMPTNHGALVSSETSQHVISGVLAGECTPVIGIKKYTLAYAHMEVHPQYILSK